MSSSSHVGILIEKVPDKNMEILKIACSPNLEHVVALDKNNNISLWSIKKGERMLAVSDNKHASISLNRVVPYNFKIFNLETGKEVLLIFPDWQNEINFLSFIINGNLIMVNTKYYRAYIFTSENNVSWVCKSMIELKYFKTIYITLKGKLILFNDTIYEITMWNIETLSVKTRILIDWDYIPWYIEISDDEELLLVCAHNDEAKEAEEKTRLYSFSTETGINLSMFTTSLVIRRLHLIASQKGERLLYISGDQYNLMDPYYLTNPIDASKLFEKNEDKQIQEPYIIRSDKIIYTINTKLSIKELVPDNSDDWVEFLRKKLNDRNSITAPSEKTIDIITKIIKDGIYNPDKIKFEGKYLKWELELDDEQVRLIVVDYNYHRKNWNDKKKHLDILPSFHPNGKGFILHCEILENDDFVTLEDFVFEKMKIKFLTENWTSGRILPASSYETIIYNLDIKFGNKELFKEFLLRNIDDEFYLTCYGEISMEILISIRDDKWIRRLGHNIMEKFVKDKNHLISKISLLSIIFENFKELSENHPAFIKSLLSLIAFVVPSITVNPKSTSSHLSSYGKYYHLSKISSFDIFSNPCVRLLSYPFQLREHVIFTQKDKWTGFKKPFISKNLNEILLLPEEPSLKEIEYNIEHRIEGIKRIIESKFKDLPTLKDLEDLKESIKELKTNK
ncbi:21610_t:CDS:2 [Dentiscutata erythropus]|uniref:21610_t:CDS:1 n=1 Tax=Dentiscutata erythropus TaxID=1348616 RepID=A0A9N9EYZ9_9GLOM|nr:21610_t:CDS:2 [Dentiscutata erythropus]